jgi:hypothetical protein
VRRAGSPNWKSPPPAELAAELIAAFATRGRDLGIVPLIEWLFREYPNPSRYSSEYRSYRQELRTPIMEAVQLLEHAELVYESKRTEFAAYWSATRLGLATLAGGTAMVRQRIKDRTGL